MKPLTALLLMAAGLTTLAAQEPLKIGMIGLDTSHVPAFTSLLNDTNNKSHIPGARVVAAFKGGSADIPSSADRVDGFTQTLVEKYGVKLYPTIEEMCQHVDAVFLESNDGRVHLEQVKPVFAAKKPVFIDKPLAAKLKDVIAIYKLSKESGVPCWSSSSYRFYPGVVAVAQADVGAVKGAISTGPASLEPNHTDMFWYGIHATESLYTVLGTGCVTVSCTSTEDTDVITGVWNDGKVGVLYAQRNQKTASKVIKFGATGIAEQKEGGSYAPMVAEAIKSFQTGVVPVPLETTVELYAFMEAADVSKERGGAPVSVAEVLKANGWEGPLK